MDEAEAADGEVRGGGVDSVDSSPSVSMTIPEEEALLGVSVAASGATVDTCRRGVRGVVDEEGEERNESIAEVRARDMWCCSVGQSDLRRQRHAESERWMRVELAHSKMLVFASLSSTGSSPLSV